MSDLKSVLVHLDSSPGVEVRLRLATLLAHDHEAELIGLYAISSIGAEFVFAVAGDAGSLALLRETEEAKRLRARTAFHELTAGLGARAIWTEVAVRADQGLARRTRLADLVVLGQFEPGSAARDGLDASFVASAIVDSGRPALVIPYALSKGAHPAPRVAVVAWKNSRESARAASAALPLLRRCRSVHVTTWEEGEDERLEAPFDIAHFLSLHGVPCILHRNGPIEAIGDAMLSFAADVSAELLVMGCFGHWRVREWAFGGATRSILQSMTLPVLMAH